jgi:mono/diheme cytochrome c family protein
VQTGGTNLRREAIPGQNRFVLRWREMRGDSKGGTKRLVLPLLLLVMALPACSNESDKSGGAQDPDWQRGRAVYAANCIACHNNDPAKDGPIGPAIKGSSKELLETRVLTTSYPPGYKPKRVTRVMPQFPFLKDEIPYLTAYLR